MGAPADVGAHEDLAVEVGGGQLLENQLQDAEMIGGGWQRRCRGAGGRPAARLSHLGGTSETR